MWYSEFPTKYQTQREHSHDRIAQEGRSRQAVVKLAIKKERVLQPGSMV